MGVFFERRVPSPELVGVIAKAFGANPPAEADEPQALADLAAGVGPLTRTLTSALNTPPPPNPEAKAAAAAQATVDELLGGSSFNAGRFVIAFSIFAALVGGGIATEATHLTTASGTLFGFAGAIFGVVTAFLGTEKASS